MIDPILQHLRNTTPRDEYQSAETIAKALGVNRTAASRALQRLELRGKVVCRRAGAIIMWKAR